MDIERFLATHDGVVSRVQARECGIGDARIARLVRSGDWIRRACSVFFAIAWNWTPAAAVRVAAEWAGPTGALTATAAAWWLGLEIDGPRPLTVALPHGCSRRAPSGVRLVQRDPRGDRTRHRGLWVVSRPLAVLDAAVDLGRQGQTFLDRALQQRRVTLQELRAAQSRHLGRRGSPAAGRLLARAGDRAASEPERRTIALLRAAGIRGWTVNHAVTLSRDRRALLDVAFAEVRLAIEVDGWAFHVDPERFVGGRSRKRALVAEGWTVIEVTWADLVERPDEVVDEIRRILLRLSAR